MRTLLAACLLVLGTPRIAAACDDDRDDAEERVSDMTDRLLERIEALEERVAGMEGVAEADVEVDVDFDGPEEFDEIDVPDAPDIDEPDDDCDDDTRDEA